MTWDYQRSYDRVAKHLETMGEIEIEPLVREMDLDNLSETRCRQIYGSHVYAETNLSRLSSEMGDREGQRKVVQATHIWQREVGHIADVVGAVRIVFQGGRVHLLVYRPIRDAGEIATKSSLLQLVLDRFGEVFNEEFPDLNDLDVRSGADMGEAIGTRNGADGDRELLFIGSPANHAAKLIGVGRPRRLTKVIADAAAADVAAYIHEDTDPNVGEHYLARPSEAELQTLLHAHGIAWTPDECRERIQADKVKFPVASAGIHETTTKVRFDDLSYTNSKVVDGATLYADVSGFTRFVDEAESDDDRREALRSFHAIRKEMARVVKNDHEGVRVQFQGDRVQDLQHVPYDDVEAVSDEAVQTAVSLQSSFEHVLKAQLPNIADLGLAVGISRGTTIAAKLGPYAHRDRICLGKEVLRAEQNEERVGKFQTGISANVYDHLKDGLKKHFEWSDTSNCYVATGLDHRKLDLDAAASAYSSGKNVSILTGAGPTISTVPGIGRQVTPARSWGE